MLQFEKIKSIIVKSKAAWQPIILSAVYAAILTFFSLVVFALNATLDENAINFVATFQQININYITKPVIAIIPLYLVIFFCLFLLAFKIQDRLKKEKKINVPSWFLVAPILFLVIARSIIAEPYLYETFYTVIKPFAWFMDTLMFFDIKWIIDAILLVIAAAALILAFQRWSLVVISVLLVMMIPKPEPILAIPGGDNAETIIMIMADSLRKDSIENNPDLFLHDFFKKSTVIENMYTIFPASVPTMAGIFSGQYPYKYRATALSLDKPLDTTFIHSLKKEYRLSIHTDYTDEVAYRQNFNIPFDEIHATRIDFESTVYANTLTKNVVLMAFISGTQVRNKLLPKLYNAVNTNSDKTLDATLRYLRLHRQEKKIAFVFLGDSHIPFRATYPYYRPFLASQKGDQFTWAFDYEDYTYQGESAVNNKNIQNLYQMTVNKTDDHIRYFISALEKNNLLNNATIVTFADQGENLFDDNHNLYSHNNIDTRHVMNVPFAIYEKDRPGTVVSVGNYSLTDTLNIALNPDRITDYVRDDIYIEADLDVNDFSNPLHASRIGLVLNTRDLNNISITNNDLLQKHKRRAIISGDHILTYHPNDISPYALYNLKTDPLFQSDLQIDQPELFSSLQKKLDEFIEDTRRY